MGERAPKPAKQKQSPNPLTIQSPDTAKIIAKAEKKQPVVVSKHDFIPEGFVEALTDSIEFVPEGESDPARLSDFLLKVALSGDLDLHLDRPDRLALLP